MTNDEINNLIILHDKTIEKLSHKFSKEINKEVNKTFIYIKNNKFIETKIVKKSLSFKMLELYKIFYKKVFLLHKSLMEKLNVYEKYKGNNFNEIYLGIFNNSLKRNKKFISQSVSEIFKEFKISDNFRKFDDLDEKILAFSKFKTKESKRTQFYAEMSLMESYRNENIILGEELGIKKLKMFGVLDSRTTPICSRNLGKLKTDKEWNKISLLGDFSLGLHYRCRHTFLPSF